MLCSLSTFGRLLNGGDGRGSLPAPGLWQARQPPLMAMMPELLLPVLLLWQNREPVAMRAGKAPLAGGRLSPPLLPPSVARREPGVNAVLGGVAAFTDICLSATNRQRELVTTQQ